MKIVNLTPHEIKIQKNDGGIIAIPPSGVVARVAAHQTKAGEVGGIEIFKTEFGQVDGLPEPKENTIYIVSGLVLQAVKNNRPDVFAPNTNQAIRNEQGQIVVVKGLTR